MRVVKAIIPDAGLWVRQLTEVKTGDGGAEDWDGPFLQPGDAVNLEPGTVCLACHEIGSQAPSRFRYDRVAIHILAEDRNWTQVDLAAGKGWSGRLASVGRFLLWLSAEERVRVAYGHRYLHARSRVARYEKWIPKIQQAIASFPERYTDSCWSKEYLELPSAAPNSKFRLVLDRDAEQRGLRQLEDALARAEQELASARAESVRYEAHQWEWTELQDKYYANVRTTVSANAG